MRANASPLSIRYPLFEGFAYHTHGQIALDEGTEESARRAVTHFEKNLKVYEAIGFADGIVTAKSNMADAKIKYESGNIDEELLKATQDL
jgi:hypothetical protein